MLDQGKTETLNRRMPLFQSVIDLERELIREALIKSKGVKTRAAEILGISERRLRYKIKKYQIEEKFAK